MNNDQQHINEFRQCYESNDIRADDENQTSGTKNRIAKEGEKWLSFLSAIVDTGYRVFLFRDLDRMKDICNDKRIDDIQWNRCNNELTRHHFRIDTDHSRRDTAHGHHGKGQAAVSLHAVKLQTRYRQCLGIAQEHHFDGKERFELRLTRDVCERLADIFDDERQYADIRQDIEHWDNQQDWQQR